MKTIAIDKKNTKMIAHRGLSGIEMENTTAAFVAAGNRSYFGIETDVHVTADGKFVITHDDTTGRISDVNIVVEQNTLEELQKIKLYDKGLYNEESDKYRTDLYMPTLREYISICKKYGKVAVLELKNRMTFDSLMGIVEEIRSLKYLENVIFISFSYDNLTDIRRIEPTQRVQFLTGAMKQETIDRMIEEKIDLDIYQEALTKELIDFFHEKGREVNCWTVDSPESAEKYISWGVDYITTNILE